MRTRLVTVSLGVHLAAFMGLFIAGFWHLERLSAEKLHVSITQLESLPAPAGGSPAAASAVKFHPKEVKRVVKALVQPVEHHDETATPSTGTSGTATGTGTGDGSGEGSGAGEGSGTCTTPPCGDDPPVVEKKVETRFVPPPLLAGLRIAGDPQIKPPELTRSQILRDGKDRVIGAFQVCVSTAGEISSVRPMRSTGYAAYDERLVEGIRTWRYRPYLVNGSPVPVCAAVTFVYAIK